jgi:hypothetical protein
MHHIEPAFLFFSQVDSLFFCMADYICPVEIPPSSTRDELRTYARQEFERNRGVSDLVSSRSVHFISFFHPLSQLFLYCLIFKAKKEKEEGWHGRWLLGRKKEKMR